MIIIGSYSSVCFFPFFLRACFIADLDLNF